VLGSLRARRGGATFTVVEIGRSVEGGTA
jgi:hypothetical protein